MTSEDTVEDPLMSVQLYMKSKVCLISCYSPSTVFILLQETLKSVILLPNDSLKLNHETKYLMTSEDTVEDPLMSVQLYIKSKVFHFVSQSNYCFHFFCKRRLNLYF